MIDSIIAAIGRKILSVNLGPTRYILIRSWRMPRCGRKLQTAATANCSVSRASLTSKFVFLRNADAAADPAKATHPGRIASTFARQAPQLQKHRKCRKTFKQHSKLWKYRTLGNNCLIIQYTPPGNKCFRCNIPATCSAVWTAVSAWCGLNGWHAICTIDWLLRVKWSIDRSYGFDHFQGLFGFEFFEFFACSSNHIFFFFAIFVPTLFWVPWPPLHTCHRDTSHFPQAWRQFSA